MNAWKTSDESKGKFRYFRCLTKEQRSKVLCDNTNIRADLLEEKLVKHISGLCSNKEFITELLESSSDDLNNKRVPLIAKRSKYQTELDSVDKEMKNLVVALGKGTLPEKPYSLGSKNLKIGIFICIKFPVSPEYSIKYIFLQ